MKVSRARLPGKSREQSTPISVLLPVSGTITPARRCRVQNAAWVAPSHPVMLLSEIDLNRDEVAFEDLFVISIWLQGLWVIYVIVSLSLWIFISMPKSSLHPRCEVPMLSMHSSRNKEFATSRGNTCLRRLSDFYCLEQI